MSLREYQRKRDFSRTPEPRGKPRPRAEAALHFVVQKHAARRLHYDFRLELDGVLLSWAVPKGPSLDPGERRLAVHVEDHPLEYADFEGIIPKGEYGGGTVIVWDTGTWTPVGDARADYAKGRLKFRLDGAKLKGGWTLVQMHGERSEDGKNWLLIKERDDAAAAGGDAGIVDRMPKSAVSRRTIEDVAKKPARVWSSTRGGEQPVPQRPDPARRKPARLRGRAHPPTDQQVELATAVTTAPDGAHWLHEIKLDGYRILARLDDGTVTLTSRNGKDWTQTFAPLAEAIAALPARRALLDGEAVILDADGTTSFQALQNALSENRVDDVVYFAFDLLHRDGEDLAKQPLVERKTLLEELVAGGGPATESVVRYSEHVAGGGPAFFEEACRFRLEGIVSKRADAPYRPGRGKDWLKVKCVREQEFVIGGWTDPAGARTEFGALHVGYYDAAGALRFAGKVGTGFSERTLRDLSARLRARARRDPAFVDAPTGYVARGNHYVDPELVCVVRFTEWTRDGQLRHPSYEGLREDKDPQSVVREDPDVPPSSARSKSSPPVPAGRETVAGVKLTHPERVLYPEQGITKRELARFYEHIADRALPELVNRPLSIVRCPEGHERGCFFQKHANETTARGVGHVMVEEGGVNSPFLMIDDVAGLVSLAQMGALELHTWGATARDVEHPDRVVFDLDPGPGVPWTQTIDGAVQLRERLEELGLRSFVKTSGGKGLHVVVPLHGRRSGWDEVKEFARAVATEIVRRDPARFIATMSKARREGKVFIDFFRNGRGATAIAPYSTRARSGAPVATPLAWDELGPKVMPDTFHLRNLPQRLASLRKDPWDGIASVRQSITASVRKALRIA